VGKTTTCQALGACLAELGRGVLLVDLDPQAHLTLSMGIDPEKLRRAVGDALLGNTSLVSVSRETGVAGLDIAPANQGLALVEKLLYVSSREPRGTADGYEYHLKRRLGALNRELYDFILLDCAPTLGATTLNALTAADLLLIPMQCEYFAARSLRRMLELARVVRQKTNPRLRTRVLVTMYDRRNRICRIIHEQLLQELPHMLFQTEIEVDTKLREGPCYGRPITLYAPRSRGAEQYRALARELMNNGR
jgi:chromosome partitioning protein